MRECVGEWENVRVNGGVRGSEGESECVEE